VLKHLLFLLSSLVSAPLAAGMWPAVDILSIASCKNGIYGKCAHTVYYRAGSSHTVYAPERTDDGLFQKDEVIPYGIHCPPNSGTSFAGCEWQNPGSHSPMPTSKCQTMSKTGAEAWTLTNDSTCQVESAQFGFHTGAMPGAECIVFGKGPSKDSTSIISTPWGDLSADMVANAGSMYCVKPIPPSETCFIELPEGDVLDHGPLSSSDASEVKLRLNINCGKNPELAFVLGGDNLILGPGIITKLTKVKVSATQFQIISNLRTTDAQPGDYQASSIVVVTPR